MVHNTLVVRLCRADCKDDNLQDGSVFLAHEFASKFTVLRIQDVYLGSRITIFTHPRSQILKQQQKKGEKFYFVIIFFVATNLTKSKFYFWNAEEKNLDQFLKIYRSFYPKNCQ